MNDFMLQVFEFISSITDNKKNMINTPEDEQRYASCRWMVLRGLSQYKDLIPVLNLLNTKNLPPKMEYEFLLNFVKPMNRPKVGWAKRRPASLYLKAVQEYYGYNEMKAGQAIKLLSVEQLAMIEEKIRREDSWTCSKGMESKSS